MKNTVGIVTNQSGENILELSRERNINMIPLGGKYRLIDFALSNMINNGIKNIGIMGTYKYRSLVEHLKRGQKWSLDSNINGLTILDGTEIKNGRCIPKINVLDLLNNIEFLKREKLENVIISAGNIVCNVNFDNVLRNHKQNEADITMLYHLENENIISEEDIFIEIIKNNKKVIYIGGKGKGQKNIFMDIIVIRKSVLLNILKTYKNVKREIDLISIINHHIENLNVYGYEYDDYFYRINTINTYYRCNMDLLKENTENRFSSGESKVSSKIIDDYPTRYGKCCKVANSYMGGGCYIKGEISKSIIFNRVNIENGSKIKESIIMEGCKIGKDTLLENVILDKYVTVYDGIILKGEKDQPIVIGKGNNIG